MNPFLPVELLSRRILTTFDVAFREMWLSYTLRVFHICVRHFPCGGIKKQCYFSFNLLQALGIRVATTTEIHRKPQHPEEAIPRARVLLESMDEWGLAAVQSVAMECKSLVIALALAFRETTVEKV